MDDEIVEQILKAKNTVIPNLIIENYHKLGMNDSEFIFLIQLFSILNFGNETLDFEMIAKRMGKPISEIYELLQGLIEHGILSLEQSKDLTGKNIDRYSFDPLYKKLIKLLKDEHQTQKQKEGNKSQTEIYQQIEKEFGRQLSSFEMELVDDWFKQDHYSSDLILLALKEAVLSNVYNLKYMDKILVTWEKKGIKTKNDVQRMRDSRKGKTNHKKESGNNSKPPIPLIKWSK